MAGCTPAFFELLFSVMPKNLTDNAFGPMNSALSDFLILHRELIERRTSDVFFARSAPTPVESELKRGIPIFMEQLIETLNRGREVAGTIDDSEIAKTATDYGR